MNDINKVIMVGRLTRDPELKYTKGGTACTSFSIAVNSKWKEKEDVSYFNCTTWGALGEKVIIPYAKKGTQVAVEGRLEQQRWEKDGVKKDRVQIIVDSVQLLSKGSEKEQDTKINLPEYQAPTADAELFAGGDIPF